MPLTPIRIIGPTAPCIIAPTASNLWPTCTRLQRCDVYGLPADDCRDLMTPFAWLEFAGRDVTFWPNDVWTAHVMTLIVASLTGWPTGEPPTGPMAVIRWAWGSPAADELGEPAAIVETLWKRQQDNLVRQAAE
jgi:hypothetical protein